MSAIDRFIDPEDTPEEMTDAQFQEAIDRRDRIAIDRWERKQTEEANPDDLP